MASGDYTRTGARRSGDDYQDVVALDLLVEWLEHPTRFSSIRVEDDGVGALDDVVARRVDGGMVVRQVKFTTTPEAADNKWSWQRLLEQEQGKRKILPSLLQDWVEGLRKVEAIDRVEEAALISNRRAAPDVAAALTADGHIAFDRIVDQDIRQEIVRQIGTEHAARHFFNSFLFILDRPPLVIMEEGVRRRFYALGGTQQGWLNLKDALRSWVRLRSDPAPDGTIRLADIKRVSQWYTLQSLPQEFSIPADYVPPSRPFHKSIVRSLLAKRSGCTLLYASPGVGKSTYASYLFERLQRYNIPVIRHHYYLAKKNDRYEYERLGHQRAAESLMHDLARDYSEALGDRIQENPSFNQLREWLEACGRYFALQGRFLVVILDGLDHVWRERRSVDELERLLGRLLPTPDGVIIFLATQPVDDDKLPPLLRRHAPRGEWIELPLMEPVAVNRWSRFHQDELHLPDGSPVPGHYLGDIAAALYEKSAGHPLHLRYTLRALQEQGLPCTLESIRRLPGCSHHDIREYYHILMQDLSEQSRDVLYLTTSCRFSWPKNGMVVCLASPTVPEPFVREAIRKVAHMMVTDDLGLRPFHSSLPAYLQSLPDYIADASRMRRRAVEWLKGGADEQWRWGNEWLIENDLGDSQSLVAGPIRAWVVEAIAKRRTATEIDQVLNRATYAAFQRPEILPRAVEIGILHDYCNRVFDEHQHITASLLKTQLMLEEDEFLRARLLADLDGLSDEEAAVLGTAEAVRGNVEAVERCIRLLSVRLEVDQDSPRHKQREGGGQYVPQVLCIVSAADNPDVMRVVSYAARTSGQSRYVLARFSKLLRRQRKTRAMRELLTQSADTLPEHYAAALEHGVILALEEGLSIVGEVTIALAASSPFAAIYAALQGIPNVNQWQLVLPHHSRFTFERMDEWQRPGQAEAAFRQAFFCFLANNLLGRSEDNRAWLDGFETSEWMERFVGALGQVAAEAAQRLADGEKIGLSWLYSQLTVPRPSWPDEKEDTVIYAGNAAATELYLISLDLLAMGASFAPPTITSADLQTALISQYFHVQAWLKVYLENGRPWLDADAVTWLLHRQETELEQSIGQFPDRAEHFALLASLAVLHGMTDDAKRIVRLVAENLLAHGNHKDTMFFACLEVAEWCHNAGMMDDARRWLARIAPAIANVSEFTDGDETGNLPEYLADTLARIASDLLPAYFIWLAEQEEHADAEHAFHVFLSTADLTLPIHKAIASTAVDEKSLKVLAERAETGDVGAQDAQGILLAYLGPEVLPEHAETSGSNTPAVLDQRPVPSPNDYPPEQYEEFIKVLSEAHAFTDGPYVGEWLAHWSEMGRGEAAYNAVRDRAERRVGYQRHGDALYASALNLYGKKEAYPWLAKAQSEDAGWARYFTQKESAAARWEEVKQRHPNKWFDFIRDSFVGDHAETLHGVFISHHQVSRLVEYCLLLGQRELALEISEGLVRSAMEVVSPICLTEPEWLENF